MYKTYLGRHPLKGGKQYDNITSALISMLNCGRYLRSQGFQEENDTSSWSGSNMISGSIIFPEGSKVDREAFKTATNRDALLERMITKGALFKRKKFGYDYDGYDYDRSKIVRTTFVGDGYSFNLDVRDTTRERWSFILKPFIYTPRRFASEFYMALTVGIITDANLEEFAKYQQGLDDAIRQETLLVYPSQAPQRKASQNQEVEIPQAETSFINPWEVQIPKSGGKKNE